MDRDGLLSCRMQKSVMSGILFLIVIPALLAFIFAAFVTYYAYEDVQERLDYYQGYPNSVRLNIPER